MLSEVNSYLVDNYLDNFRILYTLNQRFTKMGDELPILKGILNGVVNYHNARRYLF